MREQSGRRNIPTGKIKSSPDLGEWQVSEGHQKSPGAGTEEGDSGRKNEKLVSNCVGEGHSKAWRNEVIGSLYWHVFIYVLKTSL